MTVYTVRVHSETLPSLARTIDMLGCFHTLGVDCQQQIDDLTELLEGAREVPGPQILTRERRGYTREDARKDTIRPADVIARGIQVDDR